LVLEWQFPAKPGQPFVGISFAHDLVWLFLEAAMTVTVIDAFVALLTACYNNHLRFLTIDAIRTLPVWARFGLAIILADFLAWLHHWVRHKVPWFWAFHTVHHSQRHLNMFTDMRYHLVEYLVAKTIETFPLIMVIEDPYTIVSFALFHTWYTRLYHANVKTNYGLLRYVFVTPQSHRVHHSIERQHHDRNFGVLLSVWDRLSGTQYPRCDDYPETGIDDRGFPCERVASVRSLVMTPVRQHLYPFVKIERGLRRQYRREAIPETETVSEI
jgi:sterol desaturase/sphingolipid hydroxylase (fatty acid hydroxylase superfamily)